MEHVAKTLNKTPEEVRELNLYKNEQVSFNFLRYKLNFLNLCVELFIFISSLVIQGFILTNSSSKVKNDKHNLSIYLHLCLVSMPRYSFKEMN